MLGWLAILYTIIVMPVGMILANLTLNVTSMSKFFYNYRVSSVDLFTYGAYGLGFLCSLSFFGVFYTFYTIGEIPILRVFTSSSAWDLARLRMSLKSDFGGNSFIRQVLGLMLTPFLSYVFFIYYRTTKSAWHLIAFVVYSLLSVLILTYNFEKAPLLIYLIGFILIHVLTNFILSRVKFYKAAFSILVLVVFMYVFIMGKEISGLFDINNGGGILQRVLISQVVGVFVSFQMFPEIEPFVGLSGLSVFSVPFGIEQSPGVSKLMMNYANPEGTDSGTAGFLVSLFVSEAWGNFGLFGILFSPLYVGYLIQIVNVMLMKIKKSPISLALIVYLALYWPVTTLFVKFYYNPHVLIFVTLVLCPMIFRHLFRERCYG
ncbi:hypothetical protein J4N45_17590 [Vibrio sp. SCSIO 43140]|uniref:hypothetical protein n=1 Tax=Vibrio sp. SCSIO 43140 TaxID=2819100 RepID=UPI0020766092|nr:hypothetical protein [Vibrio sp. SCSIO 43140]USD60281.1 hypothetical protein J4N45_17590 [Vibrio sp. SCSIO 43140]